MYAVGGIVYNAEICDHITDFGTVEEARAAEKAIGNAALRHCLLECP